MQKALSSVFTTEKLSNTFRYGPVIDHEFSFQVPSEELSGAMLYSYTRALLTEVSLGT